MLKNLFIYPICATVFLSACTTIYTPVFQPSTSNIEKIISLQPANVKVAEFMAKDPNVNRIALRSVRFVSPYSDSFAEYFRIGLFLELLQANLLDQDSDLEITGVLLRNEVNVDNIKLGYAEIEVELTVRKAGVVRYRKIKSVRREWGSVPGVDVSRRAIANYLPTVHMLLRRFYDDVEFRQALK